MIDELFKGNDPLPNRQTRDVRHHELTRMLESGLRTAYATACDNLIWTLRRAMLILLSRKGKQTAREIWDLGDLQSMVIYWDCHVAQGNPIPKLKDLLYEGFQKRSTFKNTLDWKSELADKVSAALQSIENPPPQECLDKTPIIIEAADIVAEQIEIKCKCQNVYKNYASVKYLNCPPEEPEVVADIYGL